MHLWQIYCCIGAAIAFIAYMLPKRLNQREQPGTSVEELEQSIQMFVDEIDKEHSLLHEMIQKEQTKHEMNRSEMKQEIAALMSQIEQLSTHVRVSKTVSDEAEKQEQVANTLRESTMRARYHELFALYEQGNSIDYVAKQLDMHSGEVQLIIQLASIDQAEGNRHVVKI